MTDITDQELRDAIEWGRRNEYSGDPAEANAAIVILATVEAPDPALAEELRGQAEWARRIGAPCNAEKIDSLAARAEQIEQENEEQREWNLAVNEQAGILARERDDARAEVERLTAEAAERNAATVASEENVAADQQANTQEILAGSLPNPADVKPGEAWEVIATDPAKKIGGGVTKHNAVAFRMTDRWIVSRNGYQTPLVVPDDYIRLVRRHVPAPRVITDPDELDKLATRAVILSTDGQADVYQHDRDGWVDITGTPMDSRSVIRVERAVTVLWEPGV